MGIAVYSSIRESMRQHFVPGTGEARRTSAPSGNPAATASSGDTVSISDAARNLSELRATLDAQTPDQNKITPDIIADNAARHSNEPSGGVSTNVETDSTNAIKQALANMEHAKSTHSVSTFSSSGVKRQNATGRNIEALQKQVEAAQEQLDQANQALQKAMSEARSDPAMAAETESDEVKDAQNVVTVANNKVLQLQEQVTRAMREAYGISPGGGGCIQGTRAGSTGVGEVKGTIGSATDPYAAARAAEAAERQGSGGTTAPEPEIPAAPSTEETPASPGE